MDAVHPFRAMPTTSSDAWRPVFPGRRNRWSPCFGISGRHAPESWGARL